MGSSKRSGSSGARRAAKVRARRRRLVEEEADRERHARLIAERAGDPRYVQQEADLGGRTISWDPGTPTGAKIDQALNGQLAAFRAKFGRDAGPDDPLFLFDPDADGPTPLSAEGWRDSMDEMIGIVDQIGIDPAYLKAARELGYLITEPNRHLFSAAEVQAWADAVKKYRDDADVDMTEMFDRLAEELESVVQQTVTLTSPEPARLLAGRVVEADLVALESDDVDSDGVGAEGEASVASMAIAVLVVWISRARREIDTPDLADTVFNWITTHLGEPTAALARQAAGILGAADTPDLTVEQLADELGPDVISVMIWLAAGLAAEYGSGGTAWLRRHDIQLHKS